MRARAASTDATSSVQRQASDSEFRWCLSLVETGLVAIWTKESVLESPTDGPLLHRWNSPQSEQHRKRQSSEPSNETHKSILSLGSTGHFQLALLQLADGWADETAASKARVALRTAEQRRTQRVDDLDEDERARREHHFRVSFRSRECSRVSFFGRKNTQRHAPTRVGFEPSRLKESLFFLKE